MRVGDPGSMPADTELLLSSWAEGSDGRAFTAERARRRGRLRREVVSSWPFFASLPGRARGALEGRACIGWWRRGLDVAGPGPSLSLVLRG